MMIIVFVGFGVVLFTIGTSLVLKAYLNTPSENTIVPKPEFDKVKLELTQSQESATKLKGQIEPLTTELEAARQNIEMYKTTIQQLETELNLLREKAETQAKGALEMVTFLTAENESLKGNAEALKLKDQELERSKELLKTLTVENGCGLNKPKDQVTRLISEKESLVKDLETSSSRIAGLENEKTALLAAQTDLQRNLEKVQELNANFLRKEEMIQHELTKSRTEAMALENDLSELERKYEQDQREAQLNIENYQDEKSSLLAARADLERNLGKIQELNANLLEKEEGIQHELTQSRAQTMGLEKISEDFKTEIEKQLKQINDLKAENRSIRKLQEETEQNLKALEKAQNESIRREKLYQSELEKSRNQLLGMEKIYSDFRSKFESMEAFNPNNKVQGKI